MNPSGPNQKQLFTIDPQSQVAAESQIVETQRTTLYTIREYPLEVILQKFTTGLDSDSAELFIPDYQRELVWSSEQKSRFIESLLLDLPIPYIFVADNHARLEIVDGSQRIRTVVEFMQDSWALGDLEVLTQLKGFRYADLPAERKLRFNRKTLRMIELTQHANEEVRRMIFDRLNTGGSSLEDMEQRMGSQPGPFLELVRELAADATFRQLCPVSEVKARRREYEELVLRFFAYRDRYMEFDKRVDRFLNEFLRWGNKRLADHPAERVHFEQQFQHMLKFVAANFKDGFRKDAGNTSVPRIRFEAIAVGVSLALDEPADLVVSQIGLWLESGEFKKLTRSDASNSRPRVIDRIHFVRDALLGREWERANSDATW